MPQSKVLKPDYAALVDRLAVLNSRAKTIENEADEIKEQLKTSGLTEIESKKYRCVVSTVAGRETLDPKLVRQFLTTEQLVDCTKYGEPSIRVTLFDR